MSTSAKHELKRDFLLDKGIPVLWEKGYNGVSVKDIVDAAGVPKGSFYNYFESKEDFVLKALEKYFNEFIVQSLNALEDDSVSCKERLLQHYEYRVNTMLGSSEFDNGCLACSMASEMSNQSEAIRKFIVVKESFMKDKLIALLEKGKETGEITSHMDATDIINFIEDAWKGASITRKEYQDDEPMHNFLKAIKNLII